MTFEKEEALTERFQKMDFKCRDWLPALDDIDYYMEHCKVSERFLSFLMWILETYNGDDIEGFSAVRKKINSILYEYLELVD